MADAHHDAACHHQRCGREAVFLGTEQHGHHDVARRAHPTVALHRDAISQPVQDERLLRVGKADLPGRTRVLEGRQWGGGTGAAVVPGDQTTSACAFDTPAATVPTPTELTSLT